MQILIRNAEGPIYEQIYRQLKAQILSGALPPGEMLPSIRALAKDLRISVITTKRAYDELEKEKYIYTMPGKGCFVAQPNVELVREEHLRQIEAHLLEARRLARQICLGEEELADMLHLLKEEDQ